MSINKNDYLSDKIPVGCPPEHIDILEGDDNSSGSKIDIHKLADSEPDWDAIHNHDVEILGQRLVSLEKKTGEIGNTVDGIPIPKSGLIPEYVDSNGPASITIGKGGSNNVHPVGETFPWVANGDTHNTSIIKHEKALNELTLRTGVPYPSVSNPGSNGANFLGTYKYAVTEAISTVTDVPVTYPLGAPLPIVIPTTNVNTTFPKNYLATDALSEAIAKIDYNVTVQMESLKNEVKSLKHQLNEALNQIEGIKQALTQDATLVLSPEWEVDDNGLQPGGDGNYVSQVIYEVSITNGITTGSLLTVSSAAPSAVAGVTNMLAYPFNLILEVANIPAPYNPGNATSISATVTATDSEGNSAVSTISNRPV